MSKKCPDCETELGDSEEVCPKCGLDLNAVDEKTLTLFERVVKIVDKRKKKMEDEQRELDARKKQAEKSDKSFFEALKKRGQ